MNEILTQVEQSVEKNIKPDIFDDYKKIVTAGMTLALHKGKDSIAASLKGSKNPITDIVKGALGIMSILRKESRGTIPPVPMVHAGFTIVLHGLDFAERSGVIESVGAAEVDQAAQTYGEQVLSLMEVSPDKLQKLANRVEGVTRDPAMMEKVRAEAQNPTPERSAPPEGAPAGAEPPGPPPAEGTPPPPGIMNQGGGNGNA